MLGRYIRCSLKTQTHKKKWNVREIGPWYLYVFGVAESESGVRLTRLGLSQGQIKVESSESIANEVHSLSLD